MRHIIPLIGLLCAAANLHAGDALYVNANIHTMDPSRPRGQSLLVRDGRIAAINPDPDDPALKADGLERIDLMGRTVLPGLIDAHGHLQGLGAFGIGRLDLSAARSFSDVVGAVRDRVARAKPGEWILGGRWDHESWPEKNLPTHAAISSISPDNPVWLRRVDGHAGIANAAAMKLAGITRTTPAPAGGEIIRDHAGEPTGVLVDNAMGLLDKALPDLSDATADQLLKAQEMCFSVGLTSVHDMGVSPREVAVYRQLEAEGKLKLRVYALVPSFYAMRYFEENGLYQGERLTVRAAKAYMDGAMGSRGAWMLEPYSDRPTDDAGKPYTGLAVSEPAFIGDLAAHALHRGYQVCVHAIGDRANREVLDAFERAAAESTRDTSATLGSSRFRIEHAQLLSPSDVPRFAALGVIASMQPTHCTSDMRWVDDRVGAERARGAYAWASLLRSGAIIAGGSDFPVESHNPFLGLYAAVTRRNLEGQPDGGWRPEQRVTREEALRMFTLSAAYAAFMEGTIGSLAPGKQADFIIIDRDIMNCDDAAIPHTRVLRTVVAGETVYPL
ncbi:MAG: amidohydrolase [Phycisphaerae bacterium]|nr:amidohydrolase [Phycisphaerae bacterium]